MKIKIDYKRIFKEGLEISEFFFMDCLLDNFDQESLCYTFPELYNSLEQEFVRKSKNLYYDMVFYINNKIVAEHNIDCLKRLIRINNDYLSNSYFLEADNKTLQEEFSKNIAVGLYNFSVSANMLLLYYFSKNIFKSEKIDFLKDEYQKSLERINSIKTNNIPTTEELKKLFGIDDDSLDEIVNQLSLFIGGQYIFPANEEEFIQNIKKTFKVDIVDDKFVTSKGLIYFFYNKFKNIMEENQKNEKLYKYLIYNIKRLSLSYHDMVSKIKVILSIQEKNIVLSNENKKLKKQIKDFNKKIETIKRSKPSETILVKENQNLFRENYLLKLEIENLQEKIKMLEEENSIFETVEDDLEIEEQKQETDDFLEDIEFKNVAIVGGKYNSFDRDKISVFFENKKCNVIFVKAEETFRRLLSIKNSDIVFFDTSFNAHGYYYKIKKEVDNQKLFYINGKNFFLLKI